MANVYAIMALREWGDIECKTLMSPARRMTPGEEFGFAFLRVFRDLETAQRYADGAQIVAMHIEEDTGGI